MILRNFYDSKLAQASYMVACAEAGQAIVIDPSRDVRQYLEAATVLGVTITQVTETHIHADYLSGSRELAAATGATIYLSAEGGEDWSYDFADQPNVVLVRDGDVIRLGNLTFDVMHTPGHTPEHIVFLLTDHATSSTPHSLFSGDLLFVGDVGRPDLLERAAGVAGTMEKGARQLFQSLQRLVDFPDALLVWPGHGAGSSCGKSLGGSPVSALGYERGTNWALQVKEEDKFVDEVLSGQPEPPNYFAMMKRLNKSGPDVLGTLPRVARLSEPVGLLVDIRPATTVRKGAYEGALAIPFGKFFTGWAGWIIGYDEKVTLLCDTAETAAAAARDMATIGLDNVAGWVSPEDLAGRASEPFQLASPGEIPSGALVLDVRATSERRVNQISGSVHIPFGYLRKRGGELPKDRPIVLHCASGGRSPIAYSVLKMQGFTDVWELPGGMNDVVTNAPGLLVTA